MIWGIDVGNTHYKVGIVKDNKVLEVFRFRTIPEQSIDEYYFQFKNICREYSLTTIPPLWISSVVPSVTIALQRLANTRDLTINWVTSESNFSFSVHPNIGAQIGADILILSEAAVQLKGENVIIVCAGTATTVFAVVAGELLGGTISPGIKGSVESLIENAALLKTVFLELPEKVIGQNTHNAFCSGILYGFAGLIDGLVTRMKEELTMPEIPVVASGGMIGKIVQGARTIDEVYPDLGMRGLVSLMTKANNH